MKTRPCHLTDVFVKLDLLGSLLAGFRGGVLVRPASSRLPFPAPGAVSVTSGPGRSISATPGERRSLGGGVGEMTSRHGGCEGRKGREA